MKMRKQLAAALWTVFLLAVSACAALAADGVIYNKYNIHVQEQLDRRGDRHFKASYANYTDPGDGHRIVRIGSPLVVQDVSRKKIVFFSQKDSITIEFELHEPRMGMSAEEYLQLITSPRPVPLTNFSKLDRQGIEAGKAGIGMTKEGVMAALGYPASHKTPSPQENTWTFWTNRFATVAVEFDNRGKVTRIIR